MNQPLLFICGPYRGDTRNNIEKAKSLSMHLWTAGYPNICPHLNSDGSRAEVKAADREYKRMADECIVKG